LRLADCTTIELPKVRDPCGNLTFIESGQHVPFEVKRVFWVYDVPTAESRGGHAHKTLHEVIVCLSGGVDVLLDDGFERRVVHLNRPWIGLHVPPMVWVAQENFAPGTACLMLVSTLFDERDYIRDYDTFVRAKRDPAGAP
jgi:hypothetical protein